MPFARLPDGQVIIAHARITATEPDTFGFAESTSWTLTLGERRLRIVDPPENDGTSGLLMDKRWLTHPPEPEEVRQDGRHHIVDYHFFHAHHLGWLSGTIEYRFDLDAMTVETAEDLTFEAD